GASLKVPTLDGTTDLTIERGTQHGHLLRVPGAGLPNLRTGRKGDLVVILTLEVPTRLTDKQEQLLREYAETEKRNVLPKQAGMWDKVKEYLGIHPDEEV